MTEIRASEQLNKRDIPLLGIVSLLFCGTVAFLGLKYPDGLIRWVNLITTVSLDSFDWAFMLTITFFIFFLLLLAFSRYGDMKLGQPDDEPEFSMISWVAMLFAAGMGAGLLFWGVAEPLHHYMDPPPEQIAMTAGSARWALVVTNLHWGIHAWGIYAMGALILGYFGFRKGLPLLASSPIIAVFPGRLGRSLASFADLVAILAVTFGIAGSLGMGVMQINSGISGLLDLPFDATTMNAATLAVLTLFYMIPVATRIDKGIKFLSNLNVLLVVAMMFYILILGPTSFALSTFATSLGDYVTSVVNLSFRLHPFSGETEWTRMWTLTYLIWWIAWTPFVGIFIARISRGRTIREFIVTVVLVPSFFSILWFAVFGGTGLYIELFGEGGLASLVLDDPSKALFALFSYFPFPAVLSVVTILLIFIFLSTSAASGSFVLAMMTSKGKLNPPTLSKLFWAAIIAALTAAIVFAGGDVSLLRALAVSGAIPFTLIMVVQVACLVKCLVGDRPGGVTREELAELIHEESAS